MGFKFETYSLKVTHIPGSKSDILYAYHGSPCLLRASTASESARGESTTSLIRLETKGFDGLSLITTHIMNHQR
jgi:hypothetical protein